MRRRLSAAGVVVASEEKLGGGGTLLTLTASRRAMEREAEHLRYVKKLKTKEFGPTQDEFTCDEREAFAGVERANFFCPAERAQLVIAMLEFIRTDDSFAKLKAVKGRDGDWTHGWWQRRAFGIRSAAPHSHTPGGREETSFRNTHHTHTHTHTPHTETRTPHHAGSLTHVLLSLELADVVAPLHQDAARLALYRQTMVVCPLASPVDEIREYYGGEVAFYFVWMVGGPPRRTTAPHDRAHPRAPR